MVIWGMVFYCLSFNHISNVNLVNLVFCVFSCLFKECDECAYESFCFLGHSSTVFGSLKAVVVVLEYSGITRLNELKGMSGLCWNGFSFIYESYYIVFQKSFAAKVVHFRLPAGPKF